MNTIDGEPSPTGPVIDRSERSGNIGLLIILAVALISAAAAFAFMSREQAEPYVLGLLGLLAVVGVFSLFAGAIGLLRFAGKGQGHELAKAFLDSMNEGALVVDHEGRIIYANKSYADIVGAATSRDVRTVERVFAGEPDVSEVVFRLAQAGRDGRAASEEVRLSNPVGQADGGPRWYRIRVRPFAVETNRKESRDLTVWRVADITGDRDDQENSFQELQRAINFLDHAPAGFFSADANGRLLYLNATLADWLGYDLARF